MSFPNLLGNPIEVYEQKREEQRLLAELILDASVKLGEFTRDIPKSVGGRPEKTLDSAVQSFEKPKQETISDKYCCTLVHRTTALPLLATANHQIDELPLLGISSTEWKAHSTRFRLFALCSYGFCACLYPSIPKGIKRRVGARRGQQRGIFNQRGIPHS